MRMRTKDCPTCWHGHTSPACGAGYIKLELFSLRRCSELMLTHVQLLAGLSAKVHAACVEAITALRTGASPLGILLVVITSDWASAVFDTPLYYMYLCCCIACIMLLYYAAVCSYYAAAVCLYYAALCLYYAALSCIMLVLCWCMLVLCWYYAAVCLLYACIMPLCLLIIMLIWCMHVLCMHVLCS